LQTEFQPTDSSFGFLLSYPTMRRNCRPLP